MTFFANFTINLKQNQSLANAGSTLHLLALLGGCPGVALAQQVLRHKSSKQDFRVIFWFTVVINLAVLGCLLSPYGETILILIPNNIGPL
jgi:hypothetical protein